MNKTINPKLQAALAHLARLWSPDPSEAAKQRAGGRVQFQGNRAERRRRGWGMRGPMQAGHVTSQRHGARSMGPCVVLSRKNRQHHAPRGRDSEHRLSPTGRTPSQPEYQSLSRRDLGR